MKASRGKDHLRFRTIYSILSATLAVALVVSALNRFSGIAFRPSGALAGGLLLMIGVAVGTIFASQPVPRVITIGVNLMFFVCIVNNLVQRLGNQLTMWAFLCMSIGLLVGALYGDVQAQRGEPEES